MTRLTGSMSRGGGRKCHFSVDLVGRPLLKFIIVHSETKRELTIPFDICASREDFELLVNQLQLYLNREDFTYGWIPIRSRILESGMNTPPVDWDRPGPSWIE